MDFQTLFKCSECKVNAESCFVSSDNCWIRCPRCGAEVVSQCAVSVFVQYGPYLAVAKERYDCVDPVRIAFMRMENALYPDRYPFADIPEPRAKFFIDLNDYFRHIYPINE